MDPNAIVEDPGCHAVPSVIPPPVTLPEHSQKPHALGSQLRAAAAEKNSGEA
jgi:hypothetical protein